jgi:hypothetical protein
LTIADMQDYIAPAVARLAVSFVRRRAERSRAAELGLTGLTAPRTRIDTTGLVGQFATGLIARRDSGPAASAWPARLGGALVADARRRRSWARALRSRGK